MGDVGSDLWMERRRLLNYVGKINSLYIFHYNIVVIAVRKIIIGRYDTTVIKRCREQCFLFKTAPGFGFSHCLEHDDSVQGKMQGSIDLCHTSFADKIKDFIVANEPYIIIRHDILSPGYGRFLWRGKALYRLFQQLF